MLAEVGRSRAGSVSTAWVQAPSTAADLGPPVASLASAALSAPRAREVPPMSPKLRIRDSVTLQAQ